MSEQKPEGLREAIEALIDGWWRLPAGVILDVREEVIMPLRRAILAAHEAASEPEAEVVEEWGVRSIAGKDGQHVGRAMTSCRDAVASAARLRRIWEMGDAPKDVIGSIHIVRRTRTIRPDVVTEWEEIDS